MPAPRWLARVNRRITNTILGPLATRLPGMGVIVHTGRTSHRQYRTPVLIFRHGNGFVIALTYGAGSDWVRNVLAHDGATLQTRGRTIRLTQPRLYRDELRRAMPVLIRPILGLLDVSDFLELRPDQVSPGMSPQATTSS